METRPQNAFFPMMVKLEGRKCVVVGGGKVAEEKIAGLLAHGAKIKLVSPRATKNLQLQATAGLLKWDKRRFRSSDVRDSFLVVAATNSSRTNSKIFQACRKHGILCNAVDDPENCDFYYPAIVRRGALQIAISTQGFSPALASRLRRELEAQFGPEWEEWVKEIGNKRREVLSRRGSMAAKRNLLTEAASAEEFRRFVERQRSGNRGESVNKKDERKSKSARPVS